MSTMQVVPVRMPSELVEEIDELVAVLGGNRSEFIRMGTEERLARLRPLMRTLADAADAADVLTPEAAERFVTAMERFQ